MLSHSNSLGNNAEKDTAGCRALTHKYIVTGGTSKMENNLKQYEVLLGNEPKAAEACFGMSNGLIPLQFPSALVSHYSIHAVYDSCQSIQFV